jgi:3-deoxy-7-phosphoheptulonate synthase
LTATTTPATSWTPGSWRSKPISHVPEWPDPAKAAEVLKQLSQLPPLVFAGEARALRDRLAMAAEGKAFVLQAGDCAESFLEVSADSIRDKLKVILQMAAVLTYGAGLPVVKIGRMAGQFAKPRSAETETVEGTELLTFRGHMINDEPPTREARTPDPSRMLAAYHYSAATLNLLRAFCKGGFADLSQVHRWNLEFVASSEEGQRYERLATEIDRALRFMKACGLDTGSVPVLHEVDFFTSHEALVLDYEEALTRVDSLTGRWYGCSAHLLWVGDRTRRPDGAHVEYLSGIENPVGCKVGPSARPEELLEVCRRLDPSRRPGRLVLISRMGADRVRELLPPLVAAVREAGHPVVWLCDPMHGNTYLSQGGKKTRRFDDILEEVAGYFEVHKMLGTWPGGIHVELTGANVTECLGGEADIGEDELSINYTSACDPRLNARQSIDLAFRVAELLRDFSL